MAKEFHSTPSCVPRIPSNLLNFRIVHYLPPPPPPPSPLLSKKRRKEKKYSHFILLFKNAYTPFLLFHFLSTIIESEANQKQLFPFHGNGSAFSRIREIHVDYSTLSLSLSLLYQHARTPSISVTSRRACRNLTSVVSLDCFSNGPPSNPLLSETAVSSSTRHDGERIVYPILVRSITNTRRGFSIREKVE